MKQDKQKSKQADRLLKQLPLNERKLQQEIRKMILQDFGYTQ